MKKSPKILSVAENTIFVENDGVPYSKLLSEFIEPYIDNLLAANDDWTLDDVMDLAIMAWNTGNLASIVSAEELEKMMAEEDDTDNDQGIDILKTLLRRKVTKFAEYDREIIDYEFEEVGEESILRVATKIRSEELSEIFMQSNFSENYIDRIAIVVKHKQAIYDWLSDNSPNVATEQLDEDSIYLIAEYHHNTDKWLRENYKKIFVKELEEWAIAKKHWPKRTYKIFNEWFEVSIASMVFDFEEEPILKI